MREDHEHVSRAVEKADGRKIVTGEASYTADFRRRLPDLLDASVLRSEIAHGYVTDVDASDARAMDGVHAVVTPWDEAVPDAPYTSAGQSYPEPSPWDLRVLREHVRFVGDPIAAVAAESRQVADRAVRAIDVTYDERPAVFDAKRAMDDDAPTLFEPGDVENVNAGADYDRNRQAHLSGEIGDVDEAFADADHVFETEVETPHQAHCALEPHVTVASTDEDGRYHLVSSTQVPNHTRRQLAHLFDVPIRDVRVTKPRIGGGFGSKQAMVVEPITLALHRKAGRPVLYETTRREEFTSMRARHPMQLRIRSAVTADGDLVGIDLYALSNTGAYGAHGMTVAANVAGKPLPLYAGTPNVRFEADVVHTNQPVCGAMRGYGAPQGHFALETHLDEVAEKLGMDPVELRKRNRVREGDHDAVAAILHDGSDGRRIRSCGLAECVERGREAVGWGDLDQPPEPTRHRAAGVALTAQGSGVPGDELGAAHLRMNEDGSFVLQVGGVDVGTGTDTTLAQIAAEVVGCRPADVVVRSSDTDLTPFDYGAYASSTTYISGQAVRKAAAEAKERLLYWGSKLLDEPAANLDTGDGRVYSAASGESVTLEEIGYASVYGDDEREQVMGSAHHSTEESPPPFGAQFVDVTVDEETGEFGVNQLVFAADCGVAINPALAEGQVEGGQHMSFEYAVGGGLSFDDDGRPQVEGFRDYGMPTATEHPPMETILVETHEPTGPFGAKSIAELPMNGVAPALSNAIRRAVGGRVTTLPITPERVKAALDDAG